MNDRMTTYKIWAPDDSLWTAWAKPVLFFNSVVSDYSLEIPEINWVSKENPENDTLIILDLPNKDGVEEGLALANIGYRPVPLYNGVNGPYEEAMIVNVRNIVAALYQGANMLKSLNLKIDAPPVFLLDSDRMKSGGKQKGKYDNRWCIFPQDMPSASFLSKQGIKKIIMRSPDTRIQNDLAHILYRYHQTGIKIYLCSGDGILKEAKLPKPSQFASLIYRFKVMLGLRRNATGGFGGEIPDQQYSSTRRYGYYRMG
jgi:hypothetical protein